jgi:hypothetical protein
LSGAGEAHGAAVLDEGDAVMSDIADDNQSLHRLIYFSRMSPSTLADMDHVVCEIFEEAERLNRAADVTGVLLACGGYFLQALEGPCVVVENLFRRIEGDRRHEAVQKLCFGPIPARQFPRWGMCCSPLSARDAAIIKILETKKHLDPERLTEAAALSLLTIVSDLQAQEAPSVLI